MPFARMEQIHNFTTRGQTAKCILICTFLLVESASEAIATMHSLVGGQRRVMA